MVHVVLQPNFILFLPGVFGCPTTVANVETVAVAPVGAMLINHALLLIIKINKLT